MGTGKIIGWSDVGAKLPLTRVFYSGPCTCMRTGMMSCLAGATAKARIGPSAITELLSPLILPTILCF